MSLTLSAEKAFWLSDADFLSGPESSQKCCEGTTCFGSETWLCFRWCCWFCPWNVHHHPPPGFGFSGDPSRANPRGVSKINSLFFGLMKGRTHSAAGVDVIFQCESWAVEWLVACTVSKRWGFGGFYSSLSSQVRPEEVVSVLFLGVLSGNLT